MKRLLSLLLVLGGTFAANAQFTQDFEASNGIADTTGATVGKWAPSPTGTAAVK